MARLDKYSDEERSHLLGLPCPSFETTPFAAGRLWLNSGLL